jgi:hypothetical protein
MFVVLLVAKLVPHFGQGPLWNKKTLIGGCPEYWWANMLYINNIYPDLNSGNVGSIFKFYYVIYLISLFCDLLITGVCNGIKITTYISNLY